MFARFDEKPAMTLQDIKETKRYRTDARTDGQRENSIPTTNKVCGEFAGGIIMHYPSHRLSKFRQIEYETVRVSFSPNCKTKKLGMIYTMLSSFC